MRPTQGPIDVELSERIAGARLLCIVGMIYVHVPGLHDMAGDMNVLGALHLWLPTFLVDGLGRASAALLSVVSGWLCAHVLLSGSRSPAALIATRARSMLVPMVLWALATVVVYAVVSLVQPTFLLEPAGSLGERLLRFLNTVLFIAEAPSGPTMHLAFLRDLFVCVVLAAPLLALLRRSPGITLTLLGSLYLWQAEPLIVLRPLVPFAFSIGLTLKLYRKRLDAADRFWPIWLVCAVAATLAIMLSGLGDRPPGSVPHWRLDAGESLLYPLSRLSWALLLWSATRALVGTSLVRWAQERLAWVFTAFCSHFLLLTVLWAALVAPGLASLPESMRGVAFLAWFIVAPALAFAIARGVMAALAGTLPSLAMAAGMPASYAWGRTPARPNDRVSLPGPGGALAADPRLKSSSDERRRDVPERAELGVKSIAG